MEQVRWDVVKMERFLWRLLSDRASHWGCDEMDNHYSNLKNIIHTAKFLVLGIFVARWRMTLITIFNTALTPRCFLNCHNLEVTSLFALILQVLSNLIICLIFSKFDICTFEAAILRGLPFFCLEGRQNTLRAQLRYDNG